MKFFPLILAGVIGFVIFGMNGGHVVGNYNATFVPSTSPVDAYTFKFISPGFGFFIASTGILYAYDGFYSSASIKTEMKDPKKS
ncbi:amino acid permease, partial [bacterium]|nr:amino acid permease [bacterium]